MIGVVGFDGGYKSAVALAIPPEGLVAGEGEFAGGPEGTGACCNADNSCTDDITQFDCTSSGGTYQGDGTDCASVDCGGGGACCIDGECSILSAADCAASLGSYAGDGTTCGEVSCIGSCCSGCGDCQNISEADCGDVGGIWYGPDIGVFSCSPNPCLGGCCHSGVCSTETPDNCIGSGGTYLGAVAVGVDYCSTFGNPCPEGDNPGCCEIGGFCVGGFFSETDCGLAGGSWSPINICREPDELECCHYPFTVPSVFNDPFFQNN